MLLLYSAPTSLFRRQRAVERSSPAGVVQAKVPSRPNGYTDLVFEGALSRERASVGGLKKLSEVP